MGDCVMRVPLWRRGGVVAAFALVDAERYADVMRFRWRLHDGYAYGASRAVKGMPLHRYLLGLRVGDGLHSDHRNRDRLDDRLANLRVVTKAQNAQNVGAQRIGTSSYRGVSWRPDLQKWVVQHKLDKRVHYLGAFEDEDEAGRVAAAWRAENMPFSAEVAA